MLLTIVISISVPKYTPIKSLQRCFWGNFQLTSHSAYPRKRHDDIGHILQPYAIKNKIIHKLRSSMITTSYYCTDLWEYFFKENYRKWTLRTGSLGEKNSLTFVYRNLESSSTRNTLISQFQIYFSQTFPLIVKQFLDKRTVQFKEYRTQKL